MAEKHYFGGEDAVIAAAAPPPVVGATTIRAAAAPDTGACLSEGPASHWQRAGAELERQRPPGLADTCVRCYLPARQPRNVVGSLKSFARRLMKKHSCSAANSKQRPK